MIKENEMTSTMTKARKAHNDLMLCYDMRNIAIKAHNATMVSAADHLVARAKRAMTMWYDMVVAEQKA